MDKNWSLSDDPGIDLSSLKDNTVSMRPLILKKGKRFFCEGYEPDRAGGRSRPCSIFWVEEDRTMFEIRVTTFPYSLGKENLWREHLR